MSLENKIQELTDVISRLLDALKSSQVMPAPAAPVMPAPVMPAPVMPAPVMPAPAAPVMPAPPDFQTTAPAMPAHAEPFSDSKGLIEYVMRMYTQMGPVKGAQIQVVLNELGYSTINEVSPADYYKVYASIEQLMKS